MRKCCEMSLDELHDEFAKAQGIIFDKSLRVEKLEKQLAEKDALLDEAQSFAHYMRRNSIVGSAYHTQASAWLAKVGGV